MQKESFQISWIIILYILFMVFNKYNSFSEVWGNQQSELTKNVKANFNSEITNMLNIEDPVNSSHDLYKLHL